LIVLASLLAVLAGAGAGPAQRGEWLSQALPVRPIQHPVATVSGKAEQGALLRGQTAPGARLTLDGNPVPVAPDGSFVIGLDRDAPASVTLVRDGAGALTIPIARRTWNIQHVNVARRPAGSTEAFLRRREPELARIRAARAQRHQVGGWRQHFLWPARGRISGRFGSQRVYRGEPGSYHGGVDVAAEAGAPVTAPADGMVVLAAPPAFSLEGNLVIIDHGHGLNSAFLHLARVDVAEGQRVRQGDPIGTVGATGRATGPHLHWALTWNGARLDPERVAGPMP